MAGARTGTNVVVLQHGQRASTFAQVQASKAALSFSSNTANLIQLKVQDIQSMLAASDSAGVVVGIDELVAMVQQNKVLGENNMMSVGSTLDALLAKVVSLSADNSAPAQKVQQLEDLVLALQDKVLQMLENLEVARQTIMLGQLAYVIDQGSTLFVLGYKPGVYIKFKELKDRKEVKQDPLAWQRWQELCSFLDSNDVTPEDVNSDTSVVRKLRMGVAHGYPGEAEAVSTADLIEWAKKLLDPDFIPAFERVMKIASWFAKPDQPLVTASLQEVKVTVSNGQAA